MNVNVIKHATTLLINKAPSISLLCWEWSVACSWEAKGSLFPANNIWPQVLSKTLRLLISKKIWELQKLNCIKVRRYCLLSLCWKNANIFFQNLFSALMKIPVENPIVLQKNYKITKLWAKRPVPRRKCYRRSSLRLKWQFTLERHWGTLYFCCEKGIS